MRLRRAIASLLAGLALACAAPTRALVEGDRIAGARALDTSFRVKDRVAVPGPHGADYVLPIAEYRPAFADEQGIFYAAPQGVLERAGFSKRPVAGGIYLSLAAARPWEQPLLYIDGGDGRILKLAIPAPALSRPGVLGFAIGGEEQR